MNESSSCPTSSPAFGVVIALDFDLSNQCEVSEISFFFNLFRFRFPDVIGCEASFQVFIYHWYIFFDEAKVCGAFFNRIIFLFLSLKSSLYVLDNSPLSDVSSAIFSPRLWLVFSFS